MTSFLDEEDGEDVFFFIAGTEISVNDWEDGSRELVLRDPEMGSYLRIDVRDGELDALACYLKEKTWKT